MNQGQLIPCMLLLNLLGSGHCVHAQGPAVTATARPEIHSGFITSADVISGGWGYLRPPAVTVSDVAGSNAVITAQISGGVVTNLYVNENGRNYSPATTIRIGPPQPELHFSRAAPNLVLMWLDASALQSATNVSGPYADVQSATSPHTNIPGSTPALYFRLRNTLFEGNPPPPTSAGNQTNCSLSLPNPTLWASVLTGATVDWYDAPTGGNQLAIGSTNYVPTNTAVGTFTYFAEARYTGTSVVSTNRTAVMLRLNPRPTATVSGTAAICNGSSAVVQAALTGIGPWQITWSDGFLQNVVNSPATRLVSPVNLFLNTATNYAYTVFAVSDAGGCLGNQPGDITGSAVITINPRPTATVSGTATICNGSSAVVQAALTGIGPWQITWSDGFLQNVVNSPATRLVSPALTASYSVLNLFDAFCAATAGDRIGSATVTVVNCP